MSPRFSGAVFLILGLAVVAGIVAARSQSTSTAAPAPPSAPPTSVTAAPPGHIHILANNTYDPARFTTSVGQKVTWNNIAGTDHNVTADNGAFNSDILSSGRSYTWTATKAGTYTYSDFLHPDMHGTIIVKP